MKGEIMFKAWWGITWRLGAIWIVFSIPALLLYSFIGDTENTIKLKPTAAYIALACLMLFLVRAKRLNQFLWKRVASVNAASTISTTLSILFVFCAVLNFLIAKNMPTDAWVNSKMLIAVFMFFLSPVVVLFVVNFKESQQRDEPQH